MKCAQIRDSLAEFVKGTLDGERMNTVREHLKKCPSCAAEAEALRGYFTAMKSLPRAKAPPDLLYKVKARIRAEDAPAAGDAFWRRWRIPISAAGALAAAALVTVFLFPQFGGKQRMAVDETGFAGAGKYAVRNAAEVPAKSDKPAKTENIIAQEIPRMEPKDRAPATVAARKAKSEAPAEYILISLSALEEAAPQASGIAESEEADLRTDSKKMEQPLAKEKRTVKKMADEAGGAALVLSTVPQQASAVAAENKAVKPQPDTRSSIRGIVVSLNGKILKDEADSLWLEIPLSSYPSFLLKLAEFGRFPPPLPAAAKNGTVKVQLKLAPAP